MTAASEPVPQPVGIVCPVFADPAALTLAVRPGDQEGSFAKGAWREAWSKLRQSQEAGYPPGSVVAPFAEVPGSGSGVNGRPGDGGMLLFTLQAAAFAKLLGRPLVAVVTLDPQQRTFLTCRFSAEPALVNAVGA